MEAGEHPTQQPNLGEFQFLRCDHLPVVEAHARLGQAVRAQAQRSLHARLEGVEVSAFAARIRWVRHWSEVIAGRASSTRLRPSIRQSLRAFLDCLQAWSAAARLRQALPAALKGQVIDDQTVSDFELGLLLQDEYSGCQTAAYRGGDGAVYLWHTEEEFSAERFDALRLFSFQVPGEGGRLVVTSFIYPDLLPGSAFNWRSDGLVQAVDTLPISPNRQPGTLLANTAAWVGLWTEANLPREEMLAGLAPFVDSYALNTAWAQDGRAHASRVAFAGGEVDALQLSESPGSYLYQCNYLPDFSSRLYSRQSITDHRRQILLARQERARRAIPALPADADPRPAILGLLGSSAEAWDYVNPTVKAALLCCVDPRGGVEVWLRPGPSAEGQWISG